jgi:hypothetical protein
METDSKTTIRLIWTNRYHHCKVLSSIQERTVLVRLVNVRSTLDQTQVIHASRVTIVLADPDTHWSVAIACVVFVRLESSWVAHGIPSHSAPILPQYHCSSYRHHPIEDSRLRPVYHPALQRLGIYCLCFSISHEPAFMV